MSAFTLAAGAAILGLLIGAALVPGAPIFALPIAVVLVVALGAAEMRRRSHESRSMQTLRKEGETEPVEFTERDKQTLAE